MILESATAEMRSTEVYDEISAGPHRRQDPILLAFSSTRQDSGAGTTKQTLYLNWSKLKLILIN